MASSDDRHLPGGDEAPPEAELSERIASIRASVAKGLNEVVVGVEERQASHAAELERSAEASLAAARSDLVREVKRRSAKSEKRLRGKMKDRAAKSEAAVADAWARIEAMNTEMRASLEAEIETRVKTKLAEASERLEGQLDAERASILKDAEVVRSELEGLSRELRRRQQRQALRIAKSESSRRIEAAVAKIELERKQVETIRAGFLAEVRSEVEAVAARSRTEIDEHTRATVGSMDGRVERAASGLGAAQELLEATMGEIRAAAGGAGEELGEALRRVEETVSKVEESRSRIAELERRAGVAEREVARSAEMARNAVVLEARMRRALTMEVAAAEQITAAERRLLDFVENR